MIKNTFKQFIKYLPFLGNKNYQKIFEVIYGFSLVGMNIGMGGDVRVSGELFVLKYIKKKEEKNKSKLIIFDVGANVGEYTKLLIDCFGNTAMIYSFEPSKKTFAKLENNIKIRENIKLFNMGFGDKKEQAELFMDGDESGLASIYQRRLDHFNIKMNKKETVLIETLDNFCQDNNIDHIDFLKLDVEGHEVKVLEGAKKMLDNSIKYIQFEFGGCNIDSRTFVQDFYYLLKDKFNLFRIVRNGIYPIKKYKEIYECFKCTNYFAERK